MGGHNLVPEYQLVVHRHTCRPRPGPDNLGRISTALEPLVNRRCGFPPADSLLMPAFSLPHNPPEVTSRLHLMQDAPAQQHQQPILAPVTCVAATASARYALEPRFIVGAEPLDQ